jgi:hypothetical protein
MRNLFLFFMLCGLCSAQTVGPIAITSTQCAMIATDQKGSVYIEVTGTWSGTLQPKAAISGQATFNVQITPSTSSTPQNTITANGGYWANVAGYSEFLLCGNTVASGAANVFLNLSNKSH